ncbi:uncharacterized protein LOC100378035 [Saccoglossus kowalevskii]|uniref:GDP-fucose protein O-fucosyltransferase 2 n=1 Tax=Saccoglossus kowalevskii TaxID=10224 RepID=A0ABM0GWD4_SACKO|nr:PREDICTED: uncharacterized protein LOC100378035 [Saccoglossus kowalevskii]
MRIWRLYVTVSGVVITATTTMIFAISFLLMTTPIHRPQKIVHRYTGPDIALETTTTDIGILTTTAKREINVVTQTKSKRYIMPIGLTGGGPNYEYKHVKIAARFAIYLNRTLVLTPFLKHRSDDLVDFNQTFDEGKLSQIVPLATVEEFKRECGSTIETIVHGTHTNDNQFYHFQRAYLTDKIAFKRLLDIDMPGEDHIVQSEEETWERLISSSRTKCIGIQYSYNFARDHGLSIPNKESMSKLVNKNLKRTPIITKVTDFVRDRICNGQPYLALHWRNKTGEQCSGDKIKWDREKCSQLLSSLSNGMDKFAKGLADIMNTHGVSCIYVAYLPYSQMSYISSSSDITKIKSQEVTSLVEDDYMFSLLEQEICYRARVFVGSAWSNWANFVGLEFEAEDKPVYYLHGVRGSTTEPMANISFVQDDPDVPRP